MSQTRWFTITRTALILGIFAALIFVVGGLPGSVAAAPSCTTDCYVDPAGDDANAGDQTNPLKSIQLAINTVDPGGTVHLAAGTYFENAAAGWRELYIDKSLTMVGAGSGVTIIELPTKLNGVEIFGTNLDVTLEGMTFTKLPANSAAAGFNLRMGLAGSSFSNLTFRDIESAYASGRNAHLEQGTYAQVIVGNSNFHHAGSWGFSVAMPVSAMTVTNSHFDNNGQTATNIQHRRGLDLYKVSNMTISGGSFNNNGGAGITIADSADLTIGNIEVLNNAVGISFWEWVSATSNVTIQNSNIEGNGDGILIGTDPGKTIDGFTITGNDVSSNGRGVVIWGAGGPITNVVVNRNNLSNNPNNRLVYGGSVVGQLNATCNWWGSNAGPGTADPMVTFNPWLMTSDLDGPCGIQVELDSTDTQVCAGGGVLDIDFSNVVGLYGYEFKVNYPAGIVSATGAFVNSWFNTGGGLVPPGWNAQCSGGTCQFAASIQNPNPALDGGGPVAKITFANLGVGGTFTPTIYDIVLTDRDGMPLAYDTGAGAPEFAACGVATVSGTVSLQGRATPGDAGIIQLVSAELGTINATFDGNGVFNVPNIPALPGGSDYKLRALHILYVGNEQPITLSPGQTLTDQNTKLLGGDANNGGLNPPLDIPPGHSSAYDTGVNMTDISCIGGSFGLGVGTCGSLPDSSTDINADGGTNIQDLSIAGGNFDVHPFQPW